MQVISPAELVTSEINPSRPVYPIISIQYPTMTAHSEFLNYISTHKTSFVQRLAEAVQIKRCAIPAINDPVLIGLYSISADAAYRSETIAMGHWLEQQLRALEVTTVLKDLGEQTLQGQRLDLPPAILGKLGDDPKKKTVLIYGHYDVQPVRGPVT